MAMANRIWHYGTKDLVWFQQEEKAGEKVGEAKAVKLYGQIPPIEKMDASLSTLINCEWVKPYSS